MLFFSGILIVGQFLVIQEITVKNNSVIELNLEDIKYDYAGK
jgi:protease-4